MKPSNHVTMRIFLISLIIVTFLLWACHRGGGRDKKSETVVEEELAFPPSPIELMEQAQQLANNL